MPGPLSPFVFDRSWTFPLPPDDLWSAICRTEDFRRWWPWLRELSGDGLVPGGRTDCVVRAPIPYSLRFSVAVTELDPGRLVAGLVDGDLAGPARLELTPDGEATVVRLAWEMELRRPLLRAAARFGRPVMEWGHDWVVSTGVEQFVGRAPRVKDGHDDHLDPQHHGGRLHGDDDGGPGTPGHGAGAGA